MDFTHPIRETKSVQGDEEESVSSTEVQLLMGSEKQYGFPELESGKKFDNGILTKLVGSYRWLIDAILMIVIFVLLLLLRDQWNRDPFSFPQVGGDFTGDGPNFPTQVVKFEADMLYAPKNMTNFFTNETLAKWNMMMPVGTGYPSGDKTFYTTSMTHQLHCVYMMARVYSGLMSNMTETLPNDHHSHFLHCVDYLRQGIMCSADLAIETHEITDPDDLGPLDGGWSGQHVCKDYSKVITYLEEQIVDGARVILPIDD